MIVSMCRLQIITLDHLFERLLAALQRLGYLHLETVGLGQAQQGSTLRRMQVTAEEQQRRQALVEARRILDELRVALGELPIPDSSETPTCQACKPEEIRSAALEIQRKVRSLRRRRRNLQQDQRILDRYMRVARLVPGVASDGEEAEALLFTFPSEERMVARLLKQRLQADATRSAQVRLFRLDGGHSVAAVVCAAEQAAKVRDVAWRAGTLEFKLPPAYRSDRLTESFRRVQADLDEIPRRLAELDAQLDRFRRQAGRYAATLDLVCAQEVERLEAKGNFLEGSLVRVLHAFLPVDKKEEVLRRANEETDGRIAVDELPLGPRIEDVPVVLRNPAFAKPFEILLRIFPPPTYGTFDPTLVNAVGVPFFFGLIVGDIAYGAVILALAIWLRSRSRPGDTLRSMTTVGIYCALSTILFGFLYGEVFGSLGVHLGLKPWIHRENPRELLLLLKIAVGIGAAHVALGLLFGMLNARRVLDRHAFCERLGQLLCLAGALLVVAGVVGVRRPLFAAAGVCLLSGLLILLFGAGLVGLIEVFSLVSNILSYSRLMALGVASVVLAMVANRLFVQLDYGLAGLLAAMVLHTLNILIAMFSPTIHTLRLHYVEFFTKFYRPGGKSYMPFGGRAESPG
jgi:V/A-type H+/Na+-transporting ATPase subunit I